MTPEELYKERVQLIDDTINLRPTSRVVNAVRVNYWPFFEYGLKLSDALRDYDRVNECFIRYHKEFNPDVASICSANSPSKVYEISGLKTVRWPGDPQGLDENSPYQYIEFETLLEDEYDEYLDSPAQFVISKWMPRTSDIFQPLTNIDWFGLVTRMTGAVDAFTTKPMLEMYKKLEQIAEVKADYGAKTAQLRKAITEMGIPSISGPGSATAFDLVADSLRCTMGFFADILLQPENVVKTMDRFLDFHINGSLAACKASGSKYAWVMLHKAFDNWALAMIDNGLIPVLFTEGPYTQRLKYLAELPEGKCLIHFEEVDFKEAKRILGGKNCMMGGFPNQLLMFGTPEKVADKAKEVMDIMCPGGGYMFGTAASVDQAPRANMEALFQTIRDYGKF